MQEELFRRAAYKLAIYTLNKCVQELLSDHVLGCWENDPVWHRLSLEALDLARSPSREAFDRLFSEVFCDAEPTTREEFWQEIVMS